MSTPLRIVIGDNISHFQSQRNFNLGDKKPSILVLNYVTFMSDLDLSSLLKRLRDHLPDGAFIRIAEPDRGHPGQGYRDHCAPTPAFRDVKSLCSLIENQDMLPRVVECWKDGILITNEKLIRLAPVHRSATIDNRFHDPKLRFTSLIVDALIDRNLQDYKRRGPEINPAFREVVPSDPRHVLQRVENTNLLLTTPNSYFEMPYADPPTMEWPDCFPPEALERMKACHQFKGHAVERTPPPLVVRTDDTLMSLAPHAEGTIIWGNCIFRQPGFLRLVGPNDPGVRCADGRYFINSEPKNCAAATASSAAIFFDGNVRNFYHWLCDALAPLFTLVNAGISFPSILLPHQMPQFVYESLDLLNIRYETLPTVPWYKIETAYWVTSRITPLYCSDEMRQLAEDMRRRAGPASPGRRIVIERQFARRVVNHEDIVARLAKFGFKSVRLEDLKFAEQVRLFAGAEIVVGPHGAGLANILFCRPGTQIVEIMPDGDHRPHFLAISRALKLPYRLIEAKAVSNDMKMEADADVVERVVKDMLETPDPVSPDDD